MSENKPFAHPLRPTTQCIKPCPIFLNGTAELGPRNTANIPPLAPEFFSCLFRIVVRGDLVVKPGYHLLAAVDPFVPVVPDGWTAGSLLRQQLDGLVELSHAFGNVLGRFLDAEIRVRECSSFIVLFKAAVLENTKHGRADVLFGKPTEDAEFMFAINQVFDLRAVNA